MKIAYLTDSTREEYESFLYAHEASLLYNSYQYKNFLEDLLGCYPKYSIIYEHDKIIAVMPMMLKEGSLGKIANSLPYYGSNGGIIGKIESQSIKDYLKENFSEGCAAVTLTSSPFIDSISLLQDKVTDQRYSQITPLQTDSLPQEYLWSIIDGSTRRNIKKAQRENVRISIENESAISFLEEVHKENMESISGKAKTKEFFMKFPQHFIPNKDYKVVVARIDNYPVAALLVFYYNKTVEYFTPAIRQEFRDKQPLALILWETMLQAIKDGYYYWNWGGTWLTQDGVYHFKKKWGAHARIYNYSTNIANQDILVANPKIFDDEYQGFYIYNFNQVKHND